MSAQHSVWNNQASPEGYAGQEDFFEMGSGNPAEACLARCFAKRKLR
jgi:hypothetical protein